MKTLTNTKRLIKKAYNRIWMIRRLKSMDCPVPLMIKLLQQSIIPVLETGVQCWGSMITQHEENLFERVIKTCLHVIYGDKYSRYQSALKRAGLDTMKNRRSKLILKFTIKAYNSEKFNNWFKAEDDKNRNTRAIRKLVKEVPSRTKRYEKSPIPHMARILNDNQENILKLDIQIQCDHCPHKFSSKLNLKHHMKYRHEEINPPIISHPTTTKPVTNNVNCEQCGKTLFSRANLKQHIKSKHKNSVNDDIPDNGIEAIVCNSPA